MSRSARDTPQHRGSTGSPSVGIVWGVTTGAAPLRLIADCTPLSEAEPYGDFLTHPRGHFEVWEKWRRLGPAGLARRDLPSTIAWHEYEQFPRGPVVFNKPARRFTLYADRMLQNPTTMTAIIGLFGLGSMPCEIRFDAHYQSTRDL